MVSAFLIKGLVIGFSIAAPVGPIGLLCIRRSLANGLLVGLATGLGAATADAGYGCVAGFGLTAVSGFLIAQKVWLGVGGGVFIGYLGVRTYLSQPAPEAAQAGSKGILAAYSSTLMLTLTNPMTILSFAAVFASLGLGGSADYAGAAALVSGVFLGSACWWLLLSAAASRFRNQLTQSRMRGVNRISGSILFGFGCLALWNSLKG